MFKSVPVRNLADGPIIRGTKSFSAEDLKRYDPQYTGYTEIFVLKLPKIMETNKIEDIVQHSRNLKTLIEHCSTSYSGEPEISPEQAQIQMGSQDQQLNVHTVTNVEGSSFSINCLETIHEPLRHAVEKYLTMIGDPYTKHAPAFADMDMEKVLENYAMVICIVQMDPTLKTIENITIWEAVTITGAIDRDNLNYNAGDIEIVQPKAIQFGGIARVNATHYLDKVEPLLEERLSMYKTWTDIER